MSYITKPTARHPKMRTNALGLTPRDYEGAITTLCAGCGHDSISAAIVQAFCEVESIGHHIEAIFGCAGQQHHVFGIAMRSISAQ